MLSPKYHFKNFLLFRLKVPLAFFLSIGKKILIGGTDFKVTEMNPPALDLLMPPARTHQRAPKVSSDASLDSFRSMSVLEPKGELPHVPISVAML